MVEVFGALDETVLVEGTVLAEGTVNNTTKTRAGTAAIDRAVLVLLVEQSDNLVTLLELGHLGASLDNLTGTIGARNNGEVERKGILAL